ncbi:Esterase/lipase/thioesterase family active site [Prochlorococcus marinus str. MIT 9515]|uniref:Esterase/lipase/thioesterase family active site n=1 Tax=Prochlorococcus marinus (strain MIT 9515) TaxID=167542 RepID=A2BU26_PROM5|nr:prolyl oligopeptidase family serine peptidase [Prochlorococcus marinus]ABM71287.1 Esterase/lipase/thioesterase family active site [Prochlorococcus marinus str. MIT 9515]
MINHKTLPINNVFKKKPVFNQISFCKNIIFWIDIVKKGKTYSNSIFARPFNQEEAGIQKLTGDEFNIKSHFHGYGGKSYQCIEVDEKLYLVWIDEISESLWIQVFTVNKSETINNNQYLLCKNKPRQLVESLKGNFDSSFAITNQNILLGLYELNNKDYLFSVDIRKSKQEIRILREFDDFAGNLSLSKNGKNLSWLEWKTPFMPWEKNELFFAVINQNGVLDKIKKFKNDSINLNKNVSFFQPYWIHEDIIVCSEDSSGWWNLLFIDVSDINNIVIKKRILKEFFEYGIPQWISGLSLFSGSFNNLFCLAKNKCSWVLEQYIDFSLVRTIDLPYDLLRDLHAVDDNLILIGSSNTCNERLLELECNNKRLIKLSKKSFFLSQNNCSKPESFWFKGFNNQSTHAFIYKPLYERFVNSPLIVKAHSGPTSCFDGSLNSEVQYWTSKGFMVAELNYGGSSGFGREYRERLNYKWGILDSFDCKALVLDLIRLHLVDSSKVAILGNSAGGLTAINALCEGDLFKVAICKYPVIDLNDMHHKTHRFEKGYLNSLIGEYSTCLEKYQIRSPINKINQLKKPVLLFHGKKDSVISYKKTSQIKDLLIGNNKNSEVIFFDNEGHGFKNLDNKQQVLIKTQKFLERTLNI